MDDNVSDSEEDPELNQRIKIELESLNLASESINKLENEVQKARNKFRNLKSESSQQLNALYKKIGKRFIIKTRPYYDLVQQCNKAQIEVQKASLNFQKANGMYKAAKETVTLAECQLISEDGQSVRFDSAWQELLNHANMKFGDAEKEKRICEEEHLKKAAEYSSLQQKLADIYNDMPRAITKAKQFYELKKSLETRLKVERQNAEDLHLALFCAKQKYKMALQSLEQISDQVHQQRKVPFNLPIRTPGVGAECDTLSQLSEMPSSNLDIMSEAGSTISAEDMLDLDIELSMQDLESTGNQSSDESSFDFWSKISNKLKTSSSASQLQFSQEEYSERRQTIIARNIDEFDYNNSTSEHLQTSERLGTIKANDIGWNQSHNKMESSKIIVRNSNVNIDDKSMNNRRKAILYNNNDNIGSLRNDIFIHNDERRGTLLFKEVDNNIIERQDTLKQDINDNLKSLPLDNEDNINEDNLDILRRIPSLNYYDSNEWRKTLTPDNVNTLELDDTKNFRICDPDNLELPEREFMVEGAEDSTLVSDSKLCAQSLVYNKLNDTNYSNLKADSKPPIPPQPSSGNRKSGVQIALQKTEAQSFVTTANKLEDLSTQNNAEVKELPTILNAKFKLPKNEDCFL